MFDFSVGMQEIINSLKKKSLEKGYHTIGSEFLLEEMMKIQDGIFRFLMKEYDVKEEEVEAETEKVLVIRKENGEYSNALENILKKASFVSYGKIKEEHILYGILDTKDSIALKIIMNLGLSPNDLLLDLKEIYDFKENGLDELKYTTNLTKKALNNELDELFEYDNYLERLEVILNKKYKNNPLIIGEAGVGKSALVEGFAKYCITHELNFEILSLNLGQMLANTKYRGDFEGRIEDAINYVRENKNAILFIDEIHNIMGAGQTENSLDAANILKPYLARSDIKVIGATTLEEYHKTIFKDKALRRRFNPLVIKEPDLDTTKLILKGLKESYQNYHKLKIEDDILNYLIEESDKYIFNKARPDKCIDILDEVMSYARCNKKEITKELVDYILEEHIGYKKNQSKLNYNELLKLQFLKDNNLKEENNYNYHIAFQGDTGLEYLKDDFKTLFGLTEEMTIELDMKQYQEYSTIQTLIGAPPGYVGYEEEGLLSRQISKFPMTLLILKNVESMSSNFKMIYNRIIDDGYFFDSAGNKIFTKHVILLDLVKKDEKKKVGFLSESIKPNNEYDLIINGSNKEESLNDEYEKIFNKYSLPIKLSFNVSKSHKKEINTIIYDLVSKNDKDPHEIGLKNSLVTLIK